MKKLFACLAAALLLAGCGGSGDKATSKTCTVDESGFTMAITMDAKDDVINKLSVKYTLAGILKGQENISDDDMKKAGDSILSSMGVKEGEGVTAEFKADGDDLIAVVGIDIEKADSSVLSSMGLDSDMKDMKLSQVVKEAEADGAKCE